MHRTVFGEHCSEGPSKMILRCLVFCFMVCVTIMAASPEPGDEGQFLSDEMRLFEDLMKSRNKHIRPVKWTNETVTVSFGLAVINIVDVNEKEQTITLNAWLRHHWSDATLKWAPGKYGGIDHIRIPASKIWTPDIVLYNSAAGGVDYYVDALAVVSSDGSVLWIPPVKLKSICSFDMRLFPFDTQQCVLKFGSWTYDGFKLDVTHYDGLEAADLSDFIFHNEWAVTETFGKKNMKYYPCCNEPYPDLTYSVTLKRRGTYSVYIFVIPAVLIGVLIPFMFLISARQKQKFTLGAGIMICLCLLLKQLFDMIPPSEAAFPLLVNYYITSFVLLTLSIVLCIFTTQMTEKENGFAHPPSWLKKVALSCLGRILCVSHASYSSLEEPGPMTFSSLRDTTQETTSADDDTQQITPRKSRSREIPEWYLIGLVLDRLFFIIFMVSFIIYSVSLMVH